MLLALFLVIDETQCLCGTYIGGRKSFSKSPDTYLLATRAYYDATVCSVEHLLDM
jgi:hypothetical protein